MLVLTGARQVGKSTLLLTEKPFNAFRFLSMDDYDVLRQAREQSEALWAGAERMILGEAQIAPGLLPAIKQAADRATYHVLDPLTLGEINQLPPHAWFNSF